MTEFDPRLSAQILRRVADRHQKRGEALYLDLFDLMLEGVHPWHRVYREVESMKDRAYEQFWSLRDHIGWLEAEADRRQLADLGMSR